MFRRILLGSCVAFVLSSVAVGEEPTGVRSSLFNGKDLDGWHVTGCEAGVEEGALVLQGGDGLVRTAHQYGDFILEYKAKPRKASGWDSGVYFRCELPPEGKTWPARYQANLREGLEGNVGGLPGALSKGLAKPREWNQYKLTVIGKKAALEINGQPAWQAEGLAAHAGYIALQAEIPLGGQFEFKDLFVTELGYKPLFNGQDLTGWDADSKALACWKAEDGLLLCTGKPGSWLRSAAQHGDFNLRLEYKLKPAGNSGVYIRVPQDGRHHGEGAGVEIQILDDHADAYKNLKPFQYSGSVYAIAPAQPRVTREAGQWGTMEIDCRGASYRVVHNGVVVIQAGESEFPELKQRLTQGFLGLQNHGTEVAFRNLRIGPSQQQP